MLWNPKWFPGTNLQDINLDWILKKVSALRGGSTGQVLAKKTGTDFDFEWVSGGGGSGTTDYIELENKPSINNVELVGNNTAADLGLGTYSKPSGGIPKSDLASAVRTSLSKADTALQAGALPTGGAVGQIPVKASATDFDTEWQYPLDNIQNVTISGEDLDNYTTGGHYYFQSAYAPLNKPADSGSYGFLIVLHGTANSRLTQIWIDTASNIIYSRTNSTLTVSWSDWARLTNFDSVLTDAVTVDTLPTGVSYAAAKYIQNGPFVQVYFYITRTADAMTSWQTVCTGLPPVVSTVNINGSGVPSGQWSIGGPENTRPLILLVTSAGALRVARGENAGNYLGSFCYIAK